VQRSSKLIQANQERFPDCAYYLPLFGKARRNIAAHPDICIETCKALLEGIAKTIVLGLDSTATRDDLDKKEVEPLVKAAARLLRANDDVIEDNFINRVSGLAHSLGALRNARGDISHGKAVPKIEESDREFARLCLQMTDAITFYMLQSFFTRVSPVDAESMRTNAEEPEILPGGIPNTKFEDNLAFNEDLDRRYPLEGKLLYSDALYRLYYEDYVIELEAFNDARSEEGGDDGDAD
jgi:Abortive infection C-terminus